MTEDDAGHMISFLETISENIKKLNQQAGSIDESLGHIQNLLLDIKRKQ